MRPSIRRLAVVTGLLIAACSADDTAAEIDPQPASVGETAPRAEISEYKIPHVLDGSTIHETGWSTTPQVRGDVAVGHRERDDGTLEFSAIDSTGTVLWTARRPLACTGFVLTVADDRPVAVLTNSGPGEETVLETTATAYDLHTGDELWGPSPVPGPHVGPGLVYAEVPAASMGAMGPRRALDPATGRVAADEEEDGVSIVGEYDGLVLVSDGDEVRAVLPSEDVAWRLPLSDLEVAAGDGVEVAPDTDVGADLALVGNVAVGYSLIDLDDGSVVARDVSDAVRVPGGEAVVTVVGDRLQLVAPDGDVLWTTGSPDVSSIDGVGGGVAFVRSGQTVRAHQLVDGSPARQYGGDGDGFAAMPVGFMPNGAAVVEAGAQLMLAVPGA